MLPIPDSALDDRLAFVGTSGSGKTYAAGTAGTSAGSQKMRPTAIAKAVTRLAVQLGGEVEIRPDGVIIIRPSPQSTDRPVAPKKEIRL